MPDIYESTYMITPKGVLGSDTFYVAAPNLTVAIQLARTRIRKEGWSNNLGWEVYMELCTFDE